MIPDGWKSVALGNVTEYRKGFAFNSSSYSQTGVRIIRISDTTRNSIHSNNPVYVSDEVALDQGAYILKEGDIILSSVGSRPHLLDSMVGKAVRVPPAASGSLLNQNLVKLIPLAPYITNDYLYEMLKKPAFIYFISTLVRGNANQVSITLNELFQYVFLLPPLPEQKKIAQILSTWDKAIETVEKLIANSQQKKKAMMQQLLTSKKRFPGFDGEWKKTELGELLDYKQPTQFLVKSTKYSDEYATPVLTAGKTFVLGYTNENFGVYEEGLPIIIFDDFTTASKFVDFPFKAKSSAMKILTAKQGISIKYIFEAMQMINYSVGGHQRHWISIYSNLVVNLPNIEEQQKISSALSSADQEIETWKQELKHLKQEKKALMQQLLTGKRRVQMREMEGKQPHV